jgi:hypothetical protein
MASDDATPEQSAKQERSAHNLMLQAREEVIRNRDSYLQPP